MSVVVSLLLVGVLGSANDATVQFQQNGKCLAADGFYLKSALTMQDCGAASSSTWIDGPDAKGNPQIASYFALLHAKNLCLNDDSVSCTEGTKLVSESRACAQDDVTVTKRFIKRIITYSTLLP